VRFGALYRLRCGKFRQYMSDAIMAVDYRNRSGVNDKFRLGQRFHHAIAQALPIPAQTQHTVRLMTPQVCLHERIDERRHRSAGSSA
jgi:hypothetical protein